MIVESNKTYFAIVENNTQNIPVYCKWNDYSGVTGTTKLNSDLFFNDEEALEYNIRCICDALGTKRSDYSIVSVVVTVTIK